MGIRFSAALTLGVAAAAMAYFGSVSHGGFVVGASAGATDLADPCAALAEFKPSVPTTIETAEPVDASAARPWSSPANLFTAALGVHAGVKMRTPFCRVMGVIHPTPKSQIRFEVWMPPKAAWNRKFVGSADGGSSGAINYPAMSDPVARGYAAMGHDNGHISKDMGEQTWAFDPETRKVRTEQIVDFASRAQHVVTVVSKELVDAYYGAAAVRAYYVGCSQGGHHGLMEAQRFPDDYDGIVAGSHGGDWLGMMSSEAWGANAMRKAGKLTDAQALALNAAAVKSCDAIDGLVDGQIDDPRRCRFDPAVAQCRPGQTNTPTCLTTAQVAAVRAVYAGPHTKAARPLSPGYARGSEANWTAASPMAQAEGGSFADFFRLIFKQDPTFEISQLEWNADIDAARAQLSSTFDAVDPDLSKFEARKGKLIFYHGWSDALITPFMSVAYAERLQATMGKERTDRFARLFMVPGMGHCVGGPMSNVDWLSAIDNWVDQGVNPDGRTPATTLIGAGTLGGVARTRPLCAYPEVEKYKGSGDINSASNFRCAAPSPRGA
jgi:feruloyl esterase